MTEMTREQLSAFLDDELEEREADLLVRRLSTEADLRGAAVRYAVMGDVIRGDLLDGDPRRPRRAPRPRGAPVWFSRPLQVPRSQHPWRWSRY
ncbi:MAG: hypothetical protein AMJ59_12390 [Gammaproteobacteria bacterium SG8_31]|nr:MAG: hypothetical protein AMJ59_12390 [Gammaproteobacteria bacterium SG8_31]